LAELPAKSLEHLRGISRAGSRAGAGEERRQFSEWVAEAIAPRNVAGLANPERRNLYPVDLDILLQRHALLEMSRDRVIEKLPALRGQSPEPSSSSSG
jgi:hypothetical protein